MSSIRGAQRLPWAYFCAVVISYVDGSRFGLVKVGDQDDGPSALLQAGENDDEHEQPGNADLSGTPVPLPDIVQLVQIHSNAIEDTADKHLPMEIQEAAGGSVMMRRRSSLMERLEVMQADKPPEQLFLLGICSSVTIVVGWLVVRCFVTTLLLPKSGCQEGSLADSSEPCLGRWSLAQSGSHVSARPGDKPRNHAAKGSHSPRSVSLASSSEPENNSSESPSHRKTVTWEDVAPGDEDVHSEATSNEKVEIEFEEEFEIASADGFLRTFQWVKPAEAASSGLPQPGVGEALPESLPAKVPQVVSVPAPWTSHTVREVLTKHAVNVALWEEDMFQQLAVEVAEGNTFLVLTSAGELRRTIDLVTVILLHPSSGDILVEDFTQVAKAGAMNAKQDKSPEVTPSIQKDPNEIMSHAALRCIRERLGIPTSAVELVSGKVKAFNSEETSESYPGLMTIVRRRLMIGNVLTSHDPQLNGEPWPKEKLGNFESVVGGNVHRWSWKPFEQVPELAKHRTWLDLGGRKRSTYSRGRSSQRGSFAVQRDDHEVIVPWTDAEVQAMLVGHGVSADDFAMSLTELSAQLSQGLLQFGQGRSDGKLHCVSDRVCLRLISPNGNALLVQRNASSLSWPSSARRPDESKWDVARRIARGTLGLEDSTLLIDFTSHEVEGQVQDGVIERRWVLNARVAPGMEHLCGSIHADEV